MTDERHVRLATPRSDQSAALFDSEALQRSISDTLHRGASLGARGLRHGEKFVHGVGALVIDEDYQDLSRRAQRTECREYTEWHSSEGMGKLAGTWVHDDGFFKIIEEGDGLQYREGLEGTREDICGSLSPEDEEGWLTAQVKKNNGQGDLFGTVRLKRMDEGILLNVRVVGSSTWKTIEAREGGFHPLIGSQPLLLDGQDAAVLMVFPKRTGALQDVVDPLAECMKIFVDNRSDKASDRCDRFLDPLRADILDGIDPALDPLRRPSMSGTAYQRVIRELVVNKLERSGFQATCFESIDKDEVFVLVSLDRKGPVMQMLATRFEYQKPFSKEAYERAGVQRPRNHYGIFGPEHAVHAYAAYTEGIAELLVPFNQVDVIVCVNMYLREIFNFGELKRQNVVVQYFPAANYAQQARLNDAWIGLVPRKHIQSARAPRCLDMAYRPNRNFFFLGYNIMQFPFNDINNVRSYFGEEVAFFFLWFGWFIVSLGHVAFFGFLVGMGWVRWAASWVGVNLEDRHIKYVFSLGTVLWAAIFMKRYRRVAARFAQEWGVLQNTGHTMAMWERMSSYRPELDRTWRLFFKFLCLKISGAFYCCLWCCVYFGLRFERRRISYIALVSSIWIFMGGNMWSRIVPHLITMQNHKIQARWNDQIAYSLSVVKLFLSLFPPIYLAFIKKHVEFTCSPTLGEALDHVYNDTGSSAYGGPKLLKVIDPRELDFLLERLPLPASWRPEEEVMSLDTVTDLLHDKQWSFTMNHSYAETTGLFHHVPAGLQHCIYGCFPQHCYEDKDGVMICNTNCEEAMWWQLFTFFFLHMIITITLYDIIPCFLVWASAKTEQVTAQCQARHGMIDGGLPSFTALASDAQASVAGCINCTDVSTSDEESTGTEGPTSSRWQGASPRGGRRQRHRYTWLQLQAKCFEIAEYKYWSWGGSFVEDFMELTIGFSLLMCFSSLFPLMPFMAFCCYLIEYRFIAYRMTNVTCRPWPYSAFGIGPWMNIIGIMCVYAIFNIVWFAALKDKGVHIMASVQMHLINIHEDEKRLNLFNFAIMQGAMFMAFGLVQIVIPDVPEDVLLAEDAHKQHRHMILEQLSPQSARRVTTMPSNLRNVNTALLKDFESSSGSEDSDDSANPTTPRTPMKPNGVAQNGLPGSANGDIGANSGIQMNHSDGTDSADRTAVASTSPSPRRKSAPSVLETPREVTCESTGTLGT